MKRGIFILFALWVSLSVNAQITFNFNNLALPDTGFCNGANLPGYFIDTAQNLTVKLYNNYDPTWNSWSGFAYSIWTDDTTAGYLNQWSCYPGYLIDSTFVIAYIAIDWASGSYDNIPSGLKFSQTVQPLSIYIANSTYTALTIKNGDAYTQPFSNGDYYYVKITGYLNGQPQGSVIHYLADYTDGKQFIQKDWAYVDLSAIGQVDSLTFDVFSTDTGQYGINTPAYFVFDQLKVATVQNTAFVQQQSLNLKLYPNPATSYFYLSEFVEKVEIFGISGQKVLSVRNVQRVDVSGLKSGVYLVRYWKDGKVGVERLLIMH